MLGTRSNMSRALLRHLAAKVSTQSSCHHPLTLLIQGKESRCLSHLVTLTEARCVEVRQVQPQLWRPARGLHTSYVRCEELRDVVCPPFADSISEGDVR